MRTTTLLKRVSSVYTGTTPPTSEDLFYSTEDVSWYTPSDISSDNIELGESSKFISQVYFNRSNISLFPAGSSLLVGIGASVGKVGITTKDCYSNQQINAIVFDGATIHPKFGTYWLFDKRYEINAKTPSVTLPIFNQSKVRQLEITFPSITEQTHVVEYLDSQSNIIGQRVSLLMKKRDCYLRLKTSIINRAVTRGLSENVELKDSGIKWIGTIPKQWDIKRIKDIASRVFMGKTPEYSLEDNKNYIFGQKNNQVHGIDFSGIKFGTDDFFAQRSPFEFLQYGDVLLNTLGGGSVGRTGFYNYDSSKRVITDGHVMIIRSDSYNTKFLYYFLSSKKNELEQMAIGSTNQAFFNISDIVVLYLPTPPLSEQQAIASYLDNKCAKIDAAIANIDKQIDALKRLKRALINEVVTGKREV